MNLMAREGDGQDIPEWLALHRSLGLPYSDAEWCRLPEIWKELLSTGRLKLFLVENRLKSPGSRIMSCCAALFASDRFCSEIASMMPPFLGIQVVRNYQSRQRSILNRAEIADAHAKDGLNLIVCFEGPERSRLLGDQYLALHEKRCEALHLAIAGYRIKNFLATPIGEQAYQEMLDAGTRLRRDCSNPDTITGHPLSQKPHARLVGLTKEEAEARPGSYFSGLFVHSLPRFHFSQAEQKLLRHALIGETCEDLASSMSLSPWTVKKRWRSIYDRVTEADEQLLPPPAINGPREHSRGSERRRRLLNYLRQHPEELRPCA